MTNQQKAIKARMMEKLESLRIEMLVDVAKKLSIRNDDEASVALSFALEMIEKRLTEEEFLETMLDIEEFQVAAL
jgi:hypothetical protein